MLPRSDKVVRLLVLMEVFVFTFVYLFGTHGIQEVIQCNRETKELDDEISLIQQELAELKHQLVCWQKDSYYAEKIARQELQMARPDETIYMLS